MVFHPLQFPKQPGYPGFFHCSTSNFQGQVKSAQLPWLVVSTHLKNISQNGNLPQVGVKIKNIWNQHLVPPRIPVPVSHWPTASQWSPLHPPHLWHARRPVVNSAPKSQPAPRVMTKHGWILGNFLRRRVVDIEHLKKLFGIKKTMYVYIYIQI